MKYCDHENLYIYSMSALRPYMCDILYHWINASKRKSLRQDVVAYLCVQGWNYTFGMVSVAAFLYTADSAVVMAKCHLHNSDEYLWTNLL